MIGYYKLQIKNDSTKINHVDEVISDNRITSHIDYAGEGFTKLNKGDIVLVHKGNKPYCLVEIQYLITNKKEIKGTSFGIDYKIKVLSFFSDLDDNLSFKKENKKIGYNGTLVPLYDKTSKTFQFINSWLQYLNMQKSEVQTFNLLKYKKQIILQGPPGTGKTKLAKEIAHKILNANPENLTPLEMIEEFFKEGKSNEVYNEDFRNRLAEFYQHFPKNDFHKMDLDDYCIGKSNTTNFCWWIEIGLGKYGKFTPGNSGNYVIYFSKEDDDYRLTKHPNQRISDVLPKIQSVLHKLAMNEDDSEASQIFGDSFIIKILNSYYPDKYFPINGRKSLVNALKLFNVETKKVPTLDLNLKLQKIFDNYKTKYSSAITSLDFMSFLFSHFDLKQEGGIFESSNVKGIYRKPIIIQFHPSYTYEDFVRGIVAEATDKGIVYKTENKILAELAEDAKENPYSDFVLIIDEINRANLSSVLGELIYALEYRYYFKDSEEKQRASIVESAYQLENKDINEKSRELCLPENLYIIGTMNTADRSVGHIDYAIRRRFAFVEVLPNNLSTEMKEGEFYTDLFLAVKSLFTTDDYNTKSDFISQEFEPKDVALGHSYFIDKSEQGGDEKIRWEYEIKPILIEYVRDGVLKQSALEKIKEIEASL